MISVEEALAAILSRFALLAVEETPLLDALGQVLGADVRSGINVPPHANAAMDGYAVRAADVVSAATSTPVRLRVIEDLPAGRAARQRVGPGTAIRIMTGAPLPDGADSVVPFEQTSEAQRKSPDGTVDVEATVDVGANVRRAGEDVCADSVVLSAGTTLGPPQIGLLATIGRATAPVHRRPRVAILSTGNEVVEPGRSLAPGQIYDANSFTLAAMTRRAGGVPIRLGIARDDESALIAAIDGCGDVDMFVTSAGVSVGDYDVVKKALHAMGDVHFHQVRMRPGRPLAFGRLRGVPLLGLPGNPVAAAISFELFGRPAIMRMLGRTSWERPELRARFVGSIDNYDRRASYYRVRLCRNDDGYVARLTGPQGSGILSSMVQADGLMVVDEDTASVRSGDEVRVRLFDSPEEL